MKFQSVFLLVGLSVTALASPAAAPDNSIVKRTTNFNDIFAGVEVYTSAALQICADANIDISAPLELRAAVAASLQASLDACAALLAEAAVEIEAAVQVDIEVENGGCDAKCVEKVVVEKSTRFCEDVDVIVKTLGEDCVAEYVKPAMVSYGKFAKCVDSVYVGVGASLTAVVDAVLGASLSLVLGLDLGLGLGIGLGGLIGIGR